MSTIKRTKVSFIDKDTMSAVDPEYVVVHVEGNYLIATTDYPLVSGIDDKELEIKFITHELPN